MLNSLGSFGHQFYPTPKNLAGKMMKGIRFQRGQSILEPSAGKGDLIDAMIDRPKEDINGYRHDNSAGLNDIDAVEVDPNLRHILKGKGIRVVHDDFLTFDTFKRYDLIFMNPPFDRGAEHLEKALSLLKPGGRCVCLLNAETVFHPHTHRQTALVRQLENWKANMTRIDGAFRNAERKTGVDIALIRVSRPEEKSEWESILPEDMKNAYFPNEYESAFESSVAVSDPIKALIAAYKVAVTKGVLSKLAFEDFEKAMPGELHRGKGHHYDGVRFDIKLAEMVEEIREMFWRAVFENPTFTRQLTTNLQEELCSNLSYYRNYDLTEYNILTLNAELSKRIVVATEKTIIKLFDELSYQYSWNKDTNRNVHYFDGWATNKAWCINRKVILPRPGWEWDTIRKLEDIEKCLDFLDGKTPSDTTTRQLLEDAKNQQRWWTKITLRHLRVTFYKKGTMHLEFLDEELLQKLNIFGCQHKNWLPPGYGKTKYEDLKPDERAVIDQFDGEEKYREICNRPDLLVGCEQKLQLLGFAG